MPMTNVSAMNQLKSRRSDCFTRELYRDSVDQPHQFLNLPNMIGQPGLHGRCDPQCLMDPAVIVVHEVQRDIVGVILRLL